jgi:hypothetical protein
MYPKNTSTSFTKFVLLLQIMCDYRLITEIQDDNVIILIMIVGYGGEV